MAACGILAAGGILLTYSFAQSSDEAIPGWQPVDVSLQSELPTQAPLHPQKDASPPESVPAAPAPATDSSKAAAPAPATDSSAPQALDLNAATAADLDRLPGIGPAKAKLILAYRESHHGFGSVEELLQVKGIGPKLLDKIRPHLIVRKTGNAP
ncbi:hypothetical protein E5161_06265 [Cohnella pontilimi]|uniref:Helix-hairpin-helix DNA-binding motif class 1 domain-containing protein n=2 Tax=Cohnella pontilimi TaxID=2564100 RepID=A0A4U0FFI9_9BACL|nr:hypothetical protein E5161_06265 [Cohnella pontilimi]